MTIRTRSFTTTGMHCPSCSMLIQVVVVELDGVTSAESDHRTGMTEVVYDDAILGPADIVGAIVRAGYGAEVAGDE